jgi:hypothetical protein
VIQLILLAFSAAWFNLNMDIEMQRKFECRRGLRLNDCVPGRCSFRVAPASESAGVELAAIMLLPGGKLNIHHTLG